VLSYARVEAGALPYDLEELPLDELLRGTEALVAPQLQAKGLRFRYVECDPTVRVRADGEKLQQIVLNLLSNAVTFTDAGGTITLDCEPRPDAVVVRVRDTGRGIRADKVAYVFEPFVQADPSHTRTNQGVGLGLSISRTLAVAMGGTLDVEVTELGAGTTFRLTLPRAAQAAG
jgi:signal transduction histidine kinase